MDAMIVFKDLLLKFEIEIWPHARNVVKND